MKEIQFLSVLLNLKRWTLSAVWVWFLMWRNQLGILLWIKWVLTFRPVWKSVFRTITEVKHWDRAKPLQPPPRLWSCPRTQNWTDHLQTKISDPAPPHIRFSFYKLFIPSLFCSLTQLGFTWNLPSCICELSGPNLCFLWSREELRRSRLLRSRLRCLSPASGESLWLRFLCLSRSRSEESIKRASVKSQDVDVSDKIKPVLLTRIHLTNKNWNV